MLQLADGQAKFGLAHTRDDANRSGDVIGMLAEVRTVSRAARRCLFPLPGISATTALAPWLSRVRCLTARVFSLLAIVMMLPTLCPVRADALIARIRTALLRTPLIGLARAGISSVFTREYYVRRHFIFISALRMVNARAGEMNGEAMAASESKNRFRTAVPFPAQGGSAAPFAIAQIPAACVDHGRAAAA